MLDRPKFPDPGNFGGLQTLRILVVEADVPLTKFLSRGLRSELFSVEVVHDGETALERIKGSRYDLVLLDVDLPKLDGIALLEQVRQSQPRLPMMVLTARNRTEDLVLALGSGADDFMVKPFSFIELVARMRALLRRSPAGETKRTRVGNLTVNREEYKVDRNGRPIDLTPREFAILDNLMSHAGRPVSRETLMEEVWKAPFNPDSNIVDVYMKYLRDKIDQVGEEKLIRTIRGVGYVLAEG